MVMATDLQINRKYLDTKFQGYKLDTSPLPVLSKQIPEGIDVVRPSDDQYSFLQQREFSLHNHLHNDPWDPSSVYIVSSERKIKRIIVNDSVEGGLDGPYEMCQLNFSRSKNDGHCNISLCFASADLVVASDGAGSLHILASGDRKLTPGLWKEVHRESVHDSGRLVDARLVSGNQLHCLYCYVDTKHSYITHLYLTCDEKGIWSVLRTAVLFGKGSIDYAALDSLCQTAYVIGQIEVKTQEYIDEENRKPPAEEKEISYEWQQSYEEIKIWINVNEGSKPSVTVTSLQLKVESPDGRLLLQGSFYRPIEDGLTVWQVVQREGVDKLEVVLSKRDEGSMWPQVFESSDYRGLEIPDAALAAEIHTKLAHLTSEAEDVGGATVLNSGQLEECDITDGEGRLLVQYDLSSSLASPIHKVELGNGQWLMSGPRGVTQPPPFCLRFDVDGIVWGLKGKTPHHIATFCAYGFVQASKSSRVFSFLPADASYCGLVDADGRVFIYRGGVRPSNRSEWGSQRIVCLGKTKVLGVHATTSNVFILSEKEIYVIKLL